MAAVKTEFIAGDIRKYEGIWMPLKSGIIRRTAEGSQQIQDLASRG